MKKIFILLNLIATIINLSAQDRTISGVVTAFENIPLYGASIEARKSKLEITSDSSGAFSFRSPAEEIIKVSARGFYTQKIKLESNTKFVAVNLRIKPGEKNREYAIGYGKVSDRDRLYAASNLTDGDADFSSYSNVYDLISGRFPGVEVKNGEIIIRGSQSFMGSNTALIVVNGIAVDNSVLSGIRPREIKSIDVIRDGGASIYGSRGANGVVIIEMK